MNASLWIPSKYLKRKYAKSASLTIYMNEIILNHIEIQMTVQSKGQILIFSAFYLLFFMTCPHVSDHSLESPNLQCFLYIFSISLLTCAQFLSVDNFLAP